MDLAHRMTRIYICRIPPLLPNTPYPREGHPTARMDRGYRSWAHRTPPDSSSRWWYHHHRVVRSSSYCLARRPRRMSRNRSWYILLSPYSQKSNTNSTNNLTKTPPVLGGVFKISDIHPMTKILSILSRVYRSFPHFSL